MASGMNIAQTNAITMTLSATRLATFDAARGFSSSADTLGKYSWHALTSAAFFASLHICEVTIRNAIDEALTKIYGPNWPWNPTFERSLPNPRGQNFNPKMELLRARKKLSIGTTGKLIAELKFAFWCHMFTSRYQVRIWDANVYAVFPNIPAFYSAAQARQAIYLELESLRQFRNRIAHHEPILTSPLSDRQTSIETLLAWRSNETLIWHRTWEIISKNIAAKP
jgi:hypothetical protein